MQALSLYEPQRVLHLRVWDSVGTWIVNRIFEPNDFPLYLGRDRRADILIDEPFVSRRHARLDRDGDVIVLTDIGSKAGTFIFGEPMMGRLRLNEPHRFKAIFNSFGLGARGDFCPVHVSLWHHHRDCLPRDPQQLVEIPPGPAYNPFGYEQPKSAR